MTIPSPCRKICVYDPGAGWCRGCGRTLGEISTWSTMADSDRLLVAVDCARRLEAMERESPRTRP
ncbi:DUF1289 domain-containing protein [Acinetobacter baumannii]